MSSKLQLKFDSHLDYQDEAISSVIDLFEGQTTSQSIFTVSSGARIAKLTSTNYKNIGIGNRLGDFGTRAVGKSSEDPTQKRHPPI